MTQPQPQPKPQPRSGDPLLGAARIVLLLFSIAIIFGMVMFGIGITVLLTVGRDAVLSRIAGADAPGIAYWGIIAAFGLLAGLLYLGLRFVRELDGIVGSVSEGDPFRAQNADRLSRMGWIAIIGELVALPLAALTAWFTPYLEKAGNHVDVDFGLSGESLLMILILFILARVFREGARMKADLEGTV